VKNRTVLIGLDGATFSILDSLMKDGVMPFLKEFVESGMRAELLSVVPPLTPPAWTSLMTGQRQATISVLRVPWMCIAKPSGPLPVAMVPGSPP
jgi:predicted AlkP superfamily phosphohydrolase/phosphomutase